MNEESNILFKLIRYFNNNNINLLSWFQLMNNLFLVIITAIYAYFTKRMLDNSIKQSKLISNPIIGIKIRHMGIGSVYGPERRNLGVEIDLTNVGKGAAIEVLVDAEIILKYSSIDGEKKIPARFEPNMISFIKEDEVINNSVKNIINKIKLNEVLDSNIQVENLDEEELEEILDSLDDDQRDYVISRDKMEMRNHVSFGNTCISHLLDDFREQKRLNKLRLDKNPSREFYKGPKIKIYIYYRNNLDQYFVSDYETYLHIKDIPDKEESAELTQIYIPRPKYNTHPISKEKMENEINSRNKKRELSGW